jgi:hypothetical protein
MKIITSLISVEDPSSNDFEIIFYERKQLQVIVSSLRSKAFFHSYFRGGIRTLRRSFYWWKQEDASRTIGRRSPQGVGVDKGDEEGKRNPERKAGPKRTGNAGLLARVKPLLGSERIVSRKFSLLPLRTSSDRLIPHVTLITFHVQRKISSCIYHNTVYNFVFISLP